MASGANAAYLIQNGDFVGARWALGPQAGHPVPVAYNFTSHTYLQNFAWGDTGCYCLDWVARNGQQVIQYAPANPIGYHGNVYIADASPQYDVGTFLVQQVGGLTPGQLYQLNFRQASGSYYNGIAGNTARWQVGWGGDVNWNPLSGWYLQGVTDTQRSALMQNDLVTGSSPWEEQSLYFRATDSSELLSFFATGSGNPPFAMLADVSLAPVVGVPEPAAWMSLILGLGALGGAARRRRGFRLAA